MILQALLVSKDDLTAETLIQVLAQFGVAVTRSNAADVALTRLAEERFDQVIVDFDDSEAASQLLEACRRLANPDRHPPVTIALLQDASQIRSILGAGAHFILTKPIAREQAQNTLRAATALLKRERRQSFRVAIQAPVSIRIDDSNTVEGILLDLSAGAWIYWRPSPFHPGVSFVSPSSFPKAAPALKVRWKLPGVHPTAKPASA
ncbi:MAG TPA: response regulator, partial [Terriglobales bacterium]|nr:response regulator [Terriglobales bacterium]